MDQPILVQVGTMSKRGVVKMYPPFRQILRCLLIKWIRQCERGAEAAREMLASRMRPMKEGQLDYWKAAASILGHKLATLTGDTVSLRSELEIVARITDEQPIPPEWFEYVELAELMGADDEPESAADGWGGDVRGKLAGKRTGTRGRGKGKADGTGGAKDHGQVRGARKKVRGGRAK